MKSFLLMVVGAPMLVLLALAGRLGLCRDQADRTGGQNGHPNTGKGQGHEDMITTQRKSNWSRWFLVAIYAIAMAWVESAVVFYLRSMINRIEPHQPDPFPIIGGFGWVELLREFATIVMLFTVGILAGRTWRARLGYFAIGFGVWDILYYVFLKIICGWPHSLLDWDVLFLLPMPWWGPVLAPVLISLLMIFWGTFASQFEPTSPPSLANWPVWVLNFAGVLLALYVFMADTLAAAPRGVQAVCSVVPEKFNWPLFSLALLLMSAPLMRLMCLPRCRQSLNRNDSV